MYGFIIETNRGFSASICQYSDGGGLQTEQYFRTADEARAWLYSTRRIVRLKDYTR